MGFRWFVRERARRWGLAGWVRNRPDGTVELAASGSDEGVRALVDAVRSGPPGALVDAVESLPLDDADQLPQPFTVLR